MKLSIRSHLPRLSKRGGHNYEKIVKEMKERIKEDPAIQEKFKEYGIPISQIDDVHVEFAELEVSAKTKNKKIYINKKLLDKDDIKDPTHYLAHEITHYLQQLTGNVGSHNTDDDYLDLPTEEEAFEVQVEYKKEHEGEQAAEKYVDELTSYHGLDGKEKIEKEKKFLGE